MLRSAIAELLFMDRMFSTCLLVFFFTVVLHSPVYATVFDTYGCGVRATAMGGAFTAVADDYSAAFYNPAGLAQRTGHQFYLDFFYSKPDFSVETLDGQDVVISASDGYTLNDPGNLDDLRRGHFTRVCRFDE